MPSFGMRARNAMMNQPGDDHARHARQRAGHAAKRRSPRVAAPKQADRRQRQRDEQRFRICAREKHAHRVEQEIRDRQPRPAPPKVHIRQIVKQRGADAGSQQRNQRARHEQTTAREDGKHPRHRRIQRKKHQPKPLVADAGISILRNAQIMAHIPVRPKRLKGPGKRLRSAARSVKAIGERIKRKAAQNAPQRPAPSEKTAGFETVLSSGPTRFPART